MTEPGDYATPASVDLTYQGNLGDTDALLEAMVFLSRHYPKAQIEGSSSSDIPRHHTGGNMVVIGSPGSEDTFGNRIAGTMMRETHSRVACMEDCETMPLRLDDGVHSLIPERSVSDRADRHMRVISKDYGYFPCWANPMNAASRVTIMNRVHTAGVLGAFRASSDRPDRFANYVTAVSLLAPDVVDGVIGGEACYLESVMPVEVTDGYVKTPVITPEQTWPLL